MLTNLIKRIIAMQILINLFNHKPSYSLLKPVALLALVLGLAACGGSGGASFTVTVDENRGLDKPKEEELSKVYEGEIAPRDEDVQGFRLHLWPKLALDERCGSCHVNGGAAAQYPFVRGDNINAAYDAAIGFVNLSSPSNSRLVTKVAGGHNCWKGRTPDNIRGCTEEIRKYISAWATASTPKSFLAAVKKFAPTEPRLDDIVKGKSFPATAPTEFDDLHNTLTTYCAGCHTASSPTRRSV